MGVEEISGVPYLVSFPVTLLIGTASVSVATLGDAMQPSTQKRERDIPDA